MKGFTRTTLASLILLLLSSPVTDAQPLRIAIGAVSVAHVPGIIALEGGYFAKQNLQPELIMIRGGPQTVAALVGGDVGFAQVFSVPIVSAKLGGADPVRAGWVASLSRPGGNVTGLASEYETLGGKHLELLKELDPRIERIGVLYSPASAVSAMWAKILQAELGPRLGLAIIHFPADTAPELDTALTRISRERPQALVIPAQP